jgi:hypothetical protein
MPIQIRNVRDATTATANWGSQVQQAGAKWADGYAHPARNPFDPSVIDPEAWQAGVSQPAAKTLYARNLAGVNQEVVLATVNGAGKTKYTSSGSTKQGKYAKFATTFMPKLGGILQNLNTSNPRGPRGQNRARLNAYLDAVEATRGLNA